MVGHGFDFDDADRVVGAHLPDDFDEPGVYGAGVAGDGWVGNGVVVAGDDFPPLFGAPHKVVVALVGDIPVGPDHIHAGFR